MKKHFALVLSCALLSACAGDALPSAKYAPAATNKIVLDVASISIVDHTPFEPANSPYKLYHLQPSLAEALHKWIADTFQTGGTSGQAIIVMEDATLSSHPITTSDSMMDRWFKRQQASEYNSHVSVQMEIRDSKDYGFASAEASRAITLPEDPTPAERQDAYVTLLNGLTKDFGDNFRTSIHDHVGWVVKSGP